MSHSNITRRNKEIEEKTMKKEQKNKRTKRKVKDKKTNLNLK